MRRYLGGGKRALATVGGAGRSQTLPPPSLLILCSLPLTFLVILFLFNTGSAALSWLVASIFPLGPWCATLLLIPVLLLFTKRVVLLLLRLLFLLARLLLPVLFFCHRYISL